MRHLDQAIEKLKALRLEGVRMKTDCELLAIILEKETYEDDYLELIKTEITKRTIN